MRRTKVMRSWMTSHFMIWEVRKSREDIRSSFWDVPEKFQSMQRLQETSSGDKGRLADASKVDKGVQKRSEARS